MKKYYYVEYCREDDEFGYGWKGFLEEYDEFIVYRDVSGYSNIYDSLKKFKDDVSGYAYKIVELK